VGTGRIKLPTGYNGAPTFASKITPFHGPIRKPNYLTHPLTHPTTIPNGIHIRSAVCHNALDRQTHTHRPTDGWRKYWMTIGRLGEASPNTSINTNNTLVLTLVFFDSCIAQVLRSSLLGCCHQNENTRIVKSTDLNVRYLSIESLFIDKFHEPRTGSI